MDAEVQRQVQEERRSQEDLLGKKNVQLLL